MAKDQRIPLYIQIENHFKDKISSGQLQTDERIPSEKDLMETFEVSRITVANALANLAKDGWIYRIPGRGSFVLEGNLQRSSDKSDPDELADFPPFTQSIPKSAPPRINAESPHRIIGFIISEISDQFAFRLFQGISKTVSDSGFSLVTILTHNSKQREVAAIRDLIRLGAEGLLIFPVDQQNYNEEILSLKINGFPFVLIDRYLPGIETNYVGSNSSLGAQIAVAHLYELGHRDIAICSDVPLPTVTVEERMSGYMQELKERGQLINPALILTDFSVDYEHVDDDHVLFRYIRNRLATAYVALNGVLGLLIYRFAERIGLRVPEDLSIICFDDPTAGHDDPILTHLDQSERTIGARAAELIIETINNKTAYTYQKIILNPLLVTGNSTGPLVRRVD